MIPAIVLGDKTTGGGQVIEGSPNSHVNGKPVARVGDKATCPQKGHGGVVPIVEGEASHLIDGKPVALHMATLACGCKVIASQSLYLVQKSGGGAPAKKSDLTGTALQRSDGTPSEQADEEAEEAPYWHDGETRIASASSSLSGIPIRKSFECYRWFLTDYGKKHGYKYKHIAKVPDAKHKELVDAKFFYTIGAHGKSDGTLKDDGKLVEHFEDNVNCLAYAIGVRNHGQLRFKEMFDKDVFQPQLFINLPKFKNSGCEIGNKNGWFIPFTESIPGNFVVLDIWQNASKQYEYVWHVTRRIIEEDITIIVSKDGKAGVVQNFSAAQLDSGLKTDAGSYKPTPAYTMLLPIPFVRNWEALSTLLAGDH